MSFDHPQINVSRDDAASLSVGIACACYNAELTDSLLGRVKEVLLESGVATERIAERRVPGSGELPYALNMMALSGEYDTLIALGVVLAGSTDHHRVIADSTSLAFLQIGMNTETPVINGVLTTETLSDAEERVRGGSDRGREFALAALVMGVQKRELSQGLSQGE